MPLTVAQLDQVRGWVGDEPADSELDALYDVHRSVEKVAHLVLSQRLAAMAEDPLRVSFDGDTTEDYTENIKVLERQLAKLAPLASVGGTMTAGRLVRHSRR